MPDKRPPPQFAHGSSQDPYQSLAYQFIMDGMDPKVALDMARIALDGPGGRTDVIKVDKPAPASVVSPLERFGTGMAQSKLPNATDNITPALRGAVQIPGRAEVTAYNTPGPGPVPAFDRFRSNLRYGLSHGMKGPAEQAHKDEQISATKMLKEYVMAQDAQRAAEEQKAALWRSTYSFPEANGYGAPPVNMPNRVTAVQNDIPVDPRNPGWGTLGSTNSSSPFAPLKR